MAMRGAAMAFVLLLAAVAGPVSETREDGLPRPTGYPVEPTESYGATPPCLNANGVAVTCEWYGFSYELYPTQGEQCNTVMRELYSNTTLVPVGQLSPYEYYFDEYFVFDTTTNDSYCLYGCFDMSNTAAAPSPLGSSAPPPLEVSSPPPAVLAPPPLEVSSPPPATLAPVLAPPPLEVSSPPPATLLTPPPAAPTTPSAQPPMPAPPTGTALVNLNGAGFLRPSLGFLSFVLSVALFSLIGLAAF